VPLEQEGNPDVVAKRLTGRKRTNCDSAPNIANRVEIDANFLRGTIDSECLLATWRPLLPLLVPHESLAFSRVVRPILPTHQLNIRRR